MHFDINEDRLSDGRFIGNLCQRKHDWRGTKKSLRFNSNNGCVHCRTEKAYRKKIGLPPLPSTTLTKNPDPGVDVDSRPLTENRFLGTLCKRNHDWRNTGKTLRYKDSNQCVVCSQLQVKHYRLGVDLPLVKGGHKSLEEALWSRVNKGESDECWEWQKGKSHGYGVFTFKRRRYWSHVAAYLLVHGEIPEGDVPTGNRLYILHSCDNRLCCNPKHLRAGTHQDNIADHIERGIEKRTKLTKSDVLTIRSLIEQGKTTQAELARRYQVGDMTISRIVRRERWKHI